MWYCMVRFESRNDRYLVKFLLALWILNYLRLPRAKVVDFLAWSVSQSTVLLQATSAVAMVSEGLTYTFLGASSRWTKNQQSFDQQLKASKCRIWHSRGICELNFQLLLLFNCLSRPLFLGVDHLKVKRQHTKTHKLGDLHGPMCLLCTSQKRCIQSLAWLQHIMARD